MRDRKRRSKTKNGVFRSGFFDQKKKLSYILRKSKYFFLIEKSRSKNAVFRFRSAFSISHKIGPKSILSLLFFFHVLFLRRHRPVPYPLPPARACLGKTYLWHTTVRERPKDPITYSRNDFELLEVSLLREMLRLQFQAEARDPKVIGGKGWGTTQRCPCSRGDNIHNAVFWRIFSCATVPARLEETLLV